MLTIGLMSGTSMDGIDAAIINTDGSPALIEDRGHTTLAYDAETKILLKACELAARLAFGYVDLARKFFPQALRTYLTTELKMLDINVNSKIKELTCYLHGDDQINLQITFDDVVMLSTQLHINAVRQLLSETGYLPSQIQVIGYHGQTLFHHPAVGASLIVGDGQYMANQLCTKVVTDFRSADIAAGKEHMNKDGAQLFACLAVCILNNKSLTMPGTTGVPQPLTGGSICRPEFHPLLSRITY